MTEQNEQPAAESKPKRKHSSKLLGLSLFLLLLNIFFLGTVLSPAWSGLSPYLAPRALAGVGYGFLALVLVGIPLFLSRKLSTRFTTLNLVFQTLVLIPMLVYGNLRPQLESQGLALPRSLAQGTPFPVTTPTEVKQPVRQDVPRRGHVGAEDPFSKKVDVEGSKPISSRLDARLPRIFMCSFCLKPEGRNLVSFGTNTPHVKLMTSFLVDGNPTITRTVNWSGPNLQKEETSSDSAFILERPEKGWKTGRYQATISVDGVQMKTLYFYIVPAPDPDVDELNEAIKEKRRSDVERLLDEDPGLVHGRGHHEAYSDVEEVVDRETIRFEHSVSPLFVSIATEDKSTTRLLLERGASPNAPGQTYLGLLPLHLAASEGDVKSIEMLAEAGADLDITGGLLGGTPLQMAISSGQLEAVETLLDLGASTEVVNMSGWTPLTATCLRQAEGDTEEAKAAAVQLLLDHGADPNLKSGHSGTKGSPPIFSGLNSPKVVSALIEAGADLGMTNSDGETVLQVARKRNYHQVEEILLKAGAR